MKALNICPQQKLMHVLAVISMETIYRELYAGNQNGKFLSLEGTTAFQKWVFEKGLNRYLLNLHQCQQVKEMLAYSSGVFLRFFFYRFDEQ